MIGILRLAVFGFLGLSVVYVLVSVYSRSVRREELEKEWDEGPKQGSREDFIEKGMIEYQGSLRRKLIVLVYIIPLAAIIGLLYVMNFM